MRVTIASIRAKVAKFYEVTGKRAKRVYLSPTTYEEVMGCFDPDRMKRAPDPLAPASIDGAIIEERVVMAEDEPVVLG